MRLKIALAVVSLLLVNLSAVARPIRKAELIKEANIIFLKGDYAALIKTAETTPTVKPLTLNEKKELLYLIGMSYIKLGNYAKAKKTFNDILELKGAKFREYAYIGLADSYFLEGNFNNAINVYEYVAKTYPSSERITSVYNNLGLSYKEKKDIDKANFCFKKINEQYGSSFEAEKVTYTPTGTKPAYYIVQLGAFRSMSNAKKLVRQLSRKKYDSYIQKINQSGRILYRVRGGKFSNKSYALRLGRRLRRDGFSVKIIEE